MHPDVPPLIREKVSPEGRRHHAQPVRALGFLTETEPSDLDSTLASADIAMEMGPSTVLVTSVERPDPPRGPSR
ncbi:hypothetical protein [Nocardioides daphniae]|uniref:hypothetical protein n=1 Tax=Nocardioides daphniae TaxID=402297 RepID=UPI001EE81325|nr:hypothetical protein [Nocardioides daphniae]